MSQDLVLVTIDGPIATKVMLNDPPMNPVSGRTLDALHAALDKVENSARCAA